MSSIRVENVGSIGKFRPPLSQSELWYAQYNVANVTFFTGFQLLSTNIHNGDFSWWSFLRL